MICRTVCLTHLLFKLSPRTGILHDYWIIGFDVLTAMHINKVEGNLCLSSKTTTYCLSQGSTMLHASVWTTIFRHKCALFKKHAKRVKMLEFARYRKFYNSRKTGILSILFCVPFLLKPYCIQIKMFVKIFYTNCITFDFWVHHWHIWCYNPADCNLNINKRLTPNTKACPLSSVT